MNELYLSVKVFSAKVLIGDVIFSSPPGDRTTILFGHPSQMKVYPVAEQRECLHFSVSFKILSIGLSRKSNQRDSPLCSQALYQLS